MKRTAAVMVLVACIASGCSLGERTRYAALLVASPGRAAAAGTAVGTMTFDLTLEVEGDDAQGGGPPGAGGPGGAPGAAGAAVNLTPPPQGEVPIVVDFARRAASIAVAAKGGDPEPVVVLDDTRIYVRRGSTGGISSRRWVVLDLAKLEKVPKPDANDIAERTGLLLVAFPGPLQLLELLAGSLTGSTELAGPNSYVANLSREKADTKLRLDDEAKQDRSNALSLVAVFDEVHPAKVTLDDSGRPTSLDITLHPRFRRELDVTVRVRTKLAYQPATVEIPAPEDTLTIETQGQLIGELASLGQALAGGGDAEAEAEAAA